MCLTEIAGDRENDGEGGKDCVCVFVCACVEGKQPCKVESDGVSVGIKRYGDMTGEASRKSIQH